MGEDREITTNDLIDAVEEVLTARKREQEERDATAPGNWGYYGHEYRDRTEKKEQALDQMLKGLIRQEIRAFLSEQNVSQG